MTATLALSVPEAAARLGRSERTIWRQIRSGELRTQREGRRVQVLLEPEQAWPARPMPHGTREAAVSYGTQEDWSVGRWPYTTEIVERHRLAKLARRRAAMETVKELSKRIRPDPDGLTFQDYLDADRDHPRALEGGDAADRALEKLAVERRRRR